MLVALMLLLPLGLILGLVYLNHVVERRTDPDWEIREHERILNELILAMKEQLIEVKKVVAVAIADEHRLRRQFDNEEKLAAEWHHKGQVAVGAGRDDLAREAISRAVEHDRLATEYREHLEVQHDCTNELRDSLRQLNDKIEAAKRRKNLLLARSKRAEALDGVQTVLDQGFASIEQWIDEMDELFDS